MKSTLISLAVGLVAFVGEHKVNACPGFCDQEVNFACDAFFSANGKEQTALAAIKVVRAYDSLATERTEYQSQNYVIENARSVTSWCEWATGK